MIKVAIPLVAWCVVGTLATARTGHADPMAPAPAAADGGSTSVNVDAVTSSPAALRQRCVDAMNADPAFAASIVATVDRQIDSKTLAAHVDADNHIRKNERHVIYAYAAMWAIAVAFVWFLYRRQVALQAELETLRRDVETAGKQPT